MCQGLRLITTSDKFRDCSRRNLGDHMGISFFCRRKLITRPSYTTGVAVERMTVDSIAPCINAADTARIKCPVWILPIVKCSIKGKPGLLTSARTIFQSKHSCGTTYVNRTARNQSEHIQGHWLSWFQHGGTTAIRSLLVPHLAESGHKRWIW